MGPSPYEDPNTQLSKLTQTGTVADYENKFQKISNKIPGLPESFLKGCYIGGLRSDIQCEVIGAQPYNLQHAIGLSKLYESKLGFRRNPNSQPRMYHSTSILGSRPNVSSPPNQLTPYTPGPRNALVPYVSPGGTDRPTGNVAPSSPYHKLPIKRLTAVERQAKIDKGQCYNCEEVWHKGHRCKGQMSLLLLDGVIPEGCEGLELNELQVETIECCDEEHHPQPVNGNLYALIGSPNSRCLRMQGKMAEKNLQMLVDGGSSHNFIQTRVAKYLGLDVLPSPQFSVIVGNGENLKCVGKCKQVPFEIQGHKFVSDFYVIDLHGADVVLGVAWQESFGELRLNFQQSYIKFNHAGKEVCLQGNQNTNEVTPIPVSHLHHMIKRNEVAQCFLLQLIPTTNDPASVQSSEPNPETEIPNPMPLYSLQTTPTHNHPEINDILTQFSNVFSEPKSLPPKRMFDHHIPVEPNSKPVNVKPYRYPHYQKNEIEAQVH